MKKVRSDKENMIVFEVGKTGRFQISLVTLIAAITKKSKSEIKRLWDQGGIRIYLPEEWLPEGK